MDESLSPIGIGGMKSNDLVVEMHDRHTCPFYVGIPHFGVLNALYAWDQDPRYNNSDFAMD